MQSECGDLTFHGECKGDTARWCNRSGAVEQRDCAQYGQGCGFLSEQSGYYCGDQFEQVGNCGDVTYQGLCDGAVATWCDGGSLRTRDCTSWGQSCDWAGAEKGYYCVDAPAPSCGDLTYEGVCEGAVAKWCDDGTVQTRDCADYGQACGWHSHEKGFYCL